MEDKSICDYTESEFLELVKELFNVEKTTEEEDINNLIEFKRLCEHPAGSDLIFYPDNNREDSPEGVVKEVKKWRAENGKPGFKNKIKYIIQTAFWWFGFVNIISNVNINSIIYFPISGDVSTMTLSGSRQIPGWSQCMFI